jgi:anti-sigma regulatory factor (Ser/Thr protein kinase)
MGAGGGLLPGSPDLSITFPGIPATLSAVRKVVADVMAGAPCADDLVLIACEFATNAIRHSPSGLPGGEFTLRVWVKPGWAGLEITDLGAGDWVMPPPVGSDFDDENRRGLILVAGLADLWGHSANRVWAEVTWLP